QRPKDVWLDLKECFAQTSAPHIQKAIEGKVANKKKEKKKQVLDEEASEFLKFIKQSEYKLVDQLNHMLIVNEEHVLHDIMLDKFRDVIGNITTNNYLSFRDEEISTKDISFVFANEFRKS
ncbi:hypothetical protein CR513_05951, partial [Mucuna pruriens]